ncbi:MAG: OmpA family protein [Bacteroidetes bacterium]|nr:OmpA family protein [Bacteroidota bacterium]
MKIFIFLFTLLVTSNNSFASGRDSLKVYFALDDRKLSITAQQKIDSLIYNDIIRPDQDLIILGYADYLGSKAYNIALSRARAENVKDYLLKSGFKGDKVTLCIGKGKIERAPVKGKAGYPADRIVQIIINKQPKITTAAPDITTAKTNETIKLDNIFFFPGRHVVRPESMPELEKFYIVLKEHPSLRIQIEGHICCKGPSSDGYDFDTGEYALSVNRAKTIYEYLVGKGIEPGRLKYVGFGVTRPLVYPEKNEADENMNRRVEARILAQ